MKITKRQLKRIIREEKNKFIVETRIRRAVRSMLTEKKVKKKYYQYRANPELAKKIMSDPEVNGQNLFMQGVQAYIDGQPIEDASKDNHLPNAKPQWEEYWAAGWNDAAQLAAAGIDPWKGNQSAKKPKKQKKPARQRRSTDGYTDDQLDTAEMEGGEDFEMGRSKSEVPREYRGTALEDAWRDGWNSMKRTR